MELAVNSLILKSWDCVQLWGRCWEDVVYDFHGIQICISKWKLGFGESHASTPSVFTEVLDIRNRATDLYCGIWIIWQMVSPTNKQGLFGYKTNPFLRVFRFS